MSASKEMVNIEKKLQSHGHIVTLPEFTYEYAALDSIDKVITESARTKVEHDLIRGYFNKIKDNDAVLIANIEKNGIAGYIGGNAFLEMGFAHVLQKKIFLLNPIPNLGYTDEITVMTPIILNGDLTKIS